MDTYVTHAWIATSMNGEAMLINNAQVWHPAAADANTEVFISAPAGADAAAPIKDDHERDMPSAGQLWKTFVTDEANGMSYQEYLALHKSQDPEFDINQANQAFDKFD